MVNSKVPVYLITGFIESGKTCFIKETIDDDEFLDGDRILLLLCEEGIEEYDEQELKDKKINLVAVDKPEQLTEDFIKECQCKYRPQRVIVEYNGMWNLDVLQDAMISNWFLVQIITPIDATTFETYMSNMGAVMIEQFGVSDLVIFNRCTSGTDKGGFKRRIRAVNRKAQVIFENEDGEVDNDFEEILPFDINTDIIEIKDEDYGIWYIDAIDNPDKYVGKVVKFKGMVYKSKNFEEGIFVPGRFAMTCCAEDITFLGFICKNGDIQSYRNRDWVTVTAEIKNEYYHGYEGKGPVLYAKSIEKAEPALDKVVYLN